MLTQTWVTRAHRVCVGWQRVPGAGHILPAHMFQCGDMSHWIRVYGHYRGRVTRTTLLSDHRCAHARVHSIRTRTPFSAYICSQPPNSGNCLNTNVFTGGSIAVADHYYFNLVTRVCSTFQSRGCDSTGNDFTTLAQCQTYCRSAGMMVCTVCTSPMCLQHATLARRC